MKRFRQWLFSATATASLVLLLSGFGISQRSNEFTIGTSSHWLGLYGDWKDLYIEYGRVSRPEDDWHTLTHREFPLGFAWRQEQTDVRINGFVVRPDSWINYVLIPYWFVAVLTIPIPLLWLVRHCRQRAKPANALCSDCGYDLRATPDRCPECGKVVEKVI